MRFGQLKRREFITLVGGAAAWPVTARAQQGDAYGALERDALFKGDTEYEIRVQALRQELARLGWTEGGNVQFDERWTTDNMDLVRANAASLVASNPDVVVATGGRVIPLLMQLSHTIPIVIPGVSDPVRVGYVQSLARPGGNVTGFTSFDLSIFGKMLETLKRIAPATARVAFVFNPDNPITVFFRQAFEAAAGPLAIEPIIVPITGLTTSTGPRAWPSGTMPAPFPRPTLRSRRCVRRSSRWWHGTVSTIYSDPAFPKIGGSAFYGPDRLDSIAAPPATSTVFCAAKNLVICPFNNPRNIS